MFTKEQWEILLKGVRQMSFSDPNVTDEEIEVLAADLVKAYAE
ncbi:hypothetical protein [Lactococcus phage 1358]|uniref:Uncharacterized protein n=1 Tax=Lactococcus phage 1358 TaxID=741942 RepID=D3W0G2_9CAUD|nr:hypothetical protein ABG43_gp31 [Lactococcus phage 1358]ADD25728.1 hypothetical protein [Lactococcus phage 1358]